MLEDSLIENHCAGEGRKPLSVIASTTIHIVVVSLLLVLPLVQTQALPQLGAIVPLVPFEPAVQKAEPISSAPPAPAIQRQIAADPNALFAPTRIPNEIVRQFLDDSSTTQGPISTGNLSNLLRVIETQNSTSEAAPPPPPPPVPEAPAPKIIRVSSGPQAGKLVYQPKPVYPQLAVVVRAQGIVVLEAEINEEGIIEGDTIRAISGHPLLIEAAIEAVEQWRYMPTLLNGVPVRVVTTITLNFSMK